MHNAFFQITTDQEQTTTTAPARVFRLSEARDAKIQRLAEALANAPGDPALRDRMRTLLAQNEPLPITDTTPLTTEVEIIGDTQLVEAFIFRHKLHDAIEASVRLATSRMGDLLARPPLLELEQAPDGWTHLFLVCPTLAPWSERHEQEDALMDAWHNALTPAQTEHFTLDVRCVR